MTADPLYSLPTLLERIAAALERLSEPAETDSDIPDATVLRWRAGTAALAAVNRPNLPELDDLLGLERQKDALLTQVQAFARGVAPNHALLSGARGTGKSSLVRAVFAATRRTVPELVLVAITPRELDALPDLLDRLNGVDRPFLLFCDDLTFTEADTTYHGLKGLLEGSVLGPPDNVMVIVTSNRRHLLPETFADQHGTRVIDGELHESEAIDDKLAFADRFGLWLTFPPFDQATYLRVVEHWRARLAPQLEGGPSFEEAALRFARRRGTRSGRTARQFVLTALAHSISPTDNGDASGGRR